jgi:hypothetical protein
MRPGALFICRMGAYDFHQEAAGGLAGAYLYDTENTQHI